jgi:hypothetical protein
MQAPRGEVRLCCHLAAGDGLAARRVEGGVGQVNRCHALRKASCLRRFFSGAPLLGTANGTERGRAGPCFTCIERSKRSPLVEITAVVTQLAPQVNNHVHHGTLR